MKVIPQLVTKMNNKILYMCVCVTHTYTHTHTHTHTHMYIICMYINEQMLIKSLVLYACVHVCACIHTYTKSIL